MALEHNLFAKYGLTVTRTELTGGPSVALPAAINGDFDVWDGPADASVVFCSRQPGACPLESIGTLSHNIGILLYAGPGAAITSPADLKGKIVGIYSKGSSTDLQLNAWLQLQGLQPGVDVTIVPVGGTDSTLAALTTNKIQAETLAAPLTVQAQRLGLTQIADFTKDLGDYEGALMIVRRASVQQHQDTFVAYMKGLYEGLAIARSNESDALTVAAKYSGIADPAALKSTYEANLPLLAVPPNANKAGFTRILNVLRTLRADYNIQLAASARPEDFYTDEIVQQLSSSGFITEINRKYGLQSQ